MIEARDLGVTIGRRRILEGVDLLARPGELTAIVGPNGSGKTTLLKALSGDLVYSGRISIAGSDLAALKPWQAAGLRAVLPQASNLSFPFTVREIVRLGLMGGLSGSSAEEADGLPDRALARVDLAGFAGRFYQELSGGEQQRVQLARVLCQVWAPVLEGTARFLLLDEPVSSLDLRHQLMIMDVARDFARRGGGVITVLHDLNLAALYADSIVMMKEGRVAAAGAPAAVLTDATVEAVFDCRMQVGAVPPPGTTFVLPHSVQPRA